MLNADLALSNEKKSKNSRKRTTATANDEDAGFHFIAYVPIQGQVWKLDGLERQPQSLGEWSNFVLQLLGNY